MFASSTVKTFKNRDPEIDVFTYYEVQLINTRIQMTPSRAL